MEVYPKDYCNDLDLIIVFSMTEKLYTHICNLRPQAKRYVFIYQTQSIMDSKYFMLFDQVIEFDYNQGFQKLVEIVKELINDVQKTRFVCVSDNSLAIMGDLRKILGVPGLTQQTIDTFVNKKLQKSILEKGGVRVPKYYCPSLEDYKNNLENEIEKLEKIIEYPMYSKPLQSFASLGSYKITNRNELKNAIQFYIENEYEFEVDEFLQGTLLEIDSIIVNNEILFFVCWENSSDFVKMYEGKTMSQIMYTPQHPNYNRLFKYLQDVIKAYGNIPDNVLDIEVWLTPNDELVFGELQLRRPGLGVSQVVQECTGMSLELISLELQTNNNVRIYKDDFKTNWNQYGAWFDYNIKGPKKIKGFNSIPKELKSKNKFKWKLKTDFEVKENDSKVSVAENQKMIG